MLGASFLAAGVVGFFFSSDFATGDAVGRPEHRAALLGLFDVNGWHNLVHLATGALGVFVAGRYSAARGFAILFGAAYLVVTLLGIVAGDGGTVLGLIPVSTADNVLHALVGFAGLTMGLATAPEPGPTTT